jgi:DNA repair exonuclease SbcCD nuclease subunit
VVAVTRFLCVGDLHLGAGPDYGREPGNRLRDQEFVWERVLELAVEHDVDAVLFAGDAFHRRRPTPAEMIAFQGPLQRFTAEHDIEVCAIAGNHDCEAADLPTALDVFGRDIDLYTRPGVWHADGGASVACLPWSPVSRLVAARNGGDRDDLNREAAELLLATARGLRAQIPSGQPAVLMLHWSISGASTPSGVMTDDFREVVLELAHLEQLGFDAIVAGHIHKPQRLDVVEVGAQSPIFYTGSPAPVDFGEGESEHGVWILDVGAGATRLQFVPVVSRPFVTIDCSGVALSTAGPRVDLCLFDEDEDVAGAVVRVRYTATEEQARRIDQGDIRRTLYDAGAHKVHSIQATIEREDRARVAGVDEDLDTLAALDLWFESEVIDGWLRDELRTLSARYLEEVGA